jgi:hypothetical protein
MQFKAIFQAPRVNFSAYRQLLQEQFAEHIAEAARIWLETVLPEIPIWSGASIATFFELASQASFALSAGPVAGAPNRVSLGLENATGDIVADAAAGQFTFEYATTLAHLIYNEFHNANLTPDSTLFSRLLTPGPYHFQEKGRQAFEQFASGVTLPDPVFRLKTLTV